MVEHVEEQSIAGQETAGKVDLDHLKGYHEMRVTEIHRSDVEGPNNNDPALVIVMEDEVGNKRVGKISLDQLDQTLSDLSLELHNV